MPAPLDLLIRNAAVLTMDPTHPHAAAVGVHNGVITFVGETADADSLTGPNTRIVEAHGATLTPGLIDPHIHLLGEAARRVSVDCSPDAVSSIADIRNAIADRAQTLPPGSWIRVAGYDEFSLAEQRHPTRHDLDAAAPHHPVKLVHRSGHIWVLNTLALEHAGIRIDTEEPPGATIDRDLPSGEPSGLLMEMDAWIQARTPPPSPTEIESGLSQVSATLLAHGVTFVQDASETNGLDAWNDMGQYKQRETLRIQTSMMVGAAHLNVLRAAGLGFGDERDGLHVGPVKIVLTESSASLHPAQNELNQIVANAHVAGFQVAIHAVTAPAVESAVTALERVGDIASRQGLRHRIEHASICPPNLLRRIHDAGIGIVTQPAFLYHSGNRFLQTVNPQDVPWLYRTTAIHRAGIPIAASSDAPVSPLDPRPSLYSAVTRRSRTGNVVGEPDGLEIEHALELHTRHAAHLTHQEAQRSTISIGKRADLALWDRNLLDLVAPEDLLEARILHTFLSGRSVHVS